MTQSESLAFNPPPGWPTPPKGWVPPKGWKPDPAWPAPPPGWQLWISDGGNLSGDPSPAGDSLPPEVRQAGPAAPTASSVDQRVAFLQAENAALRARLESLGAEPGRVIVLDDERVLQDVGIYRYHHPLENALAYRARLDDIAVRIAAVIKAGGAIEKSNMFTFDGSLAKGRSVTDDLSRLMLRAYNAEAENVVRSLRSGNAVTAIKRLDAARAAIAKLGRMVEMRIGDSFHALRIAEIELTADFSSVPTSSTEPLVS